MSELVVDHLSMAPQDESSKPSHSRRIAIANAFKRPSHGPMRFFIDQKIAR